MNELTERSRKLRKAMTFAEQLFWAAVRYRKLGTTFYRQKPIRFIIKNKLRYFIADFFCNEYKLVIEIDGKIHKHQQEYDEARTHIINDLGYKVLRFTNEQISSNLEACLITVKANCFLPSSRERRKGDQLL